VSNDPKDAVVDLSKLMNSQSQAPLQTSIPTISDSSRATLLTVCNENGNLVGNEYFTYNGETKHEKHD
jgi:predicted AlkP superfamily phosphohydrolase/phosphomutase